MRSCCSPQSRTTLPGAKSSDVVIGESLKTSSNHQKKYKYDMYKPYTTTCCFITHTVTIDKSLFETSVPQISFGEILYGLPMEVKSTARKIEKLLYKANSVSTAISFNEMYYYYYYYYYY